MRSFRERDPVAVGRSGMAAIGVVVPGAFNLAVPRNLVPVPVSVQEGAR